MIIGINFTREIINLIAFLLSLVAIAVLIVLWRTYKKDNEQVY